VTCVSFVFIALQLYGGYLSGSIAVYADSAHLGSDILGFAISMIALKVAQINKTDSLSYGWHRAEIIGTLLSVASMWIMTIWLVVEATNRFFEPPQVIGLVMLIVAVIGLIFNLIQIKILHSGDGHYHLGGDDGGDCHGHGHSHGPEDGHAHTHDHGHDHAHDHKHDTNAHDHAHDHAAHDHSEHDHTHAADNSTKQLEHKHSHSAQDCGHEPEKIAQIEAAANLENAAGTHREGQEAPLVKTETDDKKTVDMKKPVLKKARNLNIDAALLHVIGDCIMSVGVIIAAGIITIWPEAWMCDPICTYFFAIIVLVTTIPVTKKCIRVLMEGTPEKFDTKKLTEEIWALNTEDCKDILDVHDLHVWSISIGKNAMTVHIVSNNPLKTLSEVTDLCRREFALNHTVIQVEGPIDE
jgi:zinc transporter 2